VRDHGDGDRRQHVEFSACSAQERICTDGYEDV
jgi:hypothetical protein